MLVKRILVERDEPTMLQEQLEFPRESYLDVQNRYAMFDMNEPHLCRCIPVST